MEEKKKSKNPSSLSEKSPKTKSSTTTKSTTKKTEAPHPSTVSKPRPGEVIDDPAYAAPKGKAPKLPRYKAVIALDGVDGPITLTYRANSKEEAEAKLYADVRANFFLEGIFSEKETPRTRKIRYGTPREAVSGNFL